MSKQTFVVLANCQGGPLVRALLSVPEFSRRWMWVEIPPIFEIPALPPAKQDAVAEKILAADLLIYQRTSAKFLRFSTEEVIGDRAGTRYNLSIPNCYFTGYQPEIAYFNIGGHRIVDLLSEYNDINLLRSAIDNEAPDLAMEHMIDPAWYTSALVMENAEDSIKGLKRREAGLSISISDVIEARWQETRLFNAFNHPTSQVINPLAKRILEALAIPGSKAAVPSEDGMELCRDILPIYASVAQHLRFQPKGVAINHKTLALRQYCARWIQEFNLKYSSQAQELSTAFSVSTVAAHRHCAQRRRLTAKSTPQLPTKDPSPMPPRSQVSPNSSQTRREFLQRAGQDAEFIIEKCDPQSLGFASELIPLIRDLFPSQQGLTTLDVGARTGAGSALLAQIFGPKTFSLPKMSVTALDVNEKFANYARTFYPEVQYVVDDIFHHGIVYDLVISSHTIEHVEDPAAFVLRLQQMARQYVIVACPYMEWPEMIPGHVNCIDYAFIQSFSPLRTHVYKSLAWHGSMACWFVISGKA